MTQTRKQKIIVAAGQIIAKRGFEGMRTRDVAELAGVNHATIHYHFKDKERLIEAVVHHIVQQMYESDTAGLPESDLNGREKITAVFQRNMAQRDKHPERFAIMAELTLRASRHPQIGEMLVNLDQTIFRQMEELVAEGITDGSIKQQDDPHNLAVLLITLLRGIHSQPGQVNVTQITQAFQLIDQGILAP